MLQITVAILATWRLTHLLYAEDGPGEIFIRVRRLLGESIPGKMMDCFYCLSIWMAIPAAFWITKELIPWVFTLLAISGGACLLQRISSAIEPKRQADPPLIIETVKEADHVPVWPG